MNRDASVIVTVQLGKGRPDPAKAAECLGVPVEDVDLTLGLLPVGIGGTKYVVRVKSARLQLPRPGVEGPFSNPPITPAD